MFKMPEPDYRGPLSGEPFWDQLTVKQAVRQAVRDALEEVAIRCEAAAKDWRDVGDMQKVYATEYLVEYEIRKLKEGL